MQIRCKRIQVVCDIYCGSGGKQPQLITHMNVIGIGMHLAIVGMAVRPVDS